jgi:hypothetical protein
MSLVDEVITVSTADSMAAARAAAGSQGLLVRPPLPARTLLLSVVLQSPSQCHVGLSLGALALICTLGASRCVRCLIETA